MTAPTPDFETHAAGWAAMADEGEVKLADIIALDVGTPTSRFQMEHCLLYIDLCRRVVAEHLFADSDAFDVELDRFTVEGSRLAKTYGVTL